MNEQAHARDLGQVCELDAAELAGWLKESRGIYLYDVRSQGEVAQGTIPGAKWLPLHLVPVELQRLRTEASAGRLVLYCQIGGRSAQACMYLARLGVGPVYNLRLGLAGWLGAGGQVLQQLLPRP